MTTKRTLVTSALPYANGPLHLGHLAGAYLPADIFVRQQRLLGQDVVWVCGSDEHGAAITIRAKQDSTTPQAIIDQYHTLNKATFEKLGIAFDYYHRTSAKLHHETAQEFFKTLYAQGDQFEERTTEQYYDAEYDQFLADRYIKGTCPKCSHEDAYGDQCENCGSDLSPLELINPISTLSGKTPELKSTTHWYFRLNAHEDWIREWIEAGTVDGQAQHDPAQWRKHVVGQVQSWLDSGLQPRAITRDLDWGIPVPLEEAAGKVLYVWFDAPIGYISSTKAWAEETGGDWESYWKDPESRLVHFIGKDNIVFHCVVFPALLKAHGDYILPENVPANQFLNFEGEKFSKSRGWGIEQHEYLEAFKDFPNKEDALRWTLLRNLPENKDADFRWDEFIENHDKDLADKLGNFIHRVVTLTHKYFDGAVPDVPGDFAEVFAPALALAEQQVQQIDRYEFRAAAQTFTELASWGNTYLQEVSPWKIYKENPDDPAIAACLSVGAQTAALLSVLIAPFLPFTAPRLRALLQLSELKAGDLQATLDQLRGGLALVPAGHQLGAPEVLFAKIIDRKDSSRLDIIQAQKDKLASIQAAKAAAERPPIKETITFEDFSKLDLRTGTITAAEKMPKAKKLLKLSVDLGNEQRAIVSGIAEYYTPEDCIGKQVVIVANLAPRKLRGVESQGMILMAENAAGELGFVGAPADWPGGFGVR